jgi:glutathione S-transferase kappa 1
LALHIQTNIVPTVSPFSWFGFTNTLKYRPLLNAHGVSVEIIPFFLGAARESAGNPFTPTPKWRQAFAKQDTETTGRLLGLKIVPPTVFPILSLYVSFPNEKKNRREGESRR